MAKQTQTIRRQQLFCGLTLKVLNKIQKLTGLTAMVVRFPKDYTQITANSSFISLS